MHLNLFEHSFKESRHMTEKFKIKLIGYGIMVVLTGTMLYVFIRGYYGL